MYVKFIAANSDTTYYFLYNSDFFTLRIRLGLKPLIFLKTLQK